MCPFGERVEIQNLQNKSPIAFLRFRRASRNTQFAKINDTLACKDAVKAYATPTFEHQIKTVDPHFDDTGDLKLAFRRRTCSTVAVPSLEQAIEIESGSGTFVGCTTSATNFIIAHTSCVVDWTLGTCEHGKRIRSQVHHFKQNGRHISLHFHRLYFQVHRT